MEILKYAQDQEILDTQLMEGGNQEELWLKVVEKEEYKIAKQKLLQAKNAVEVAWLKEKKMTNKQTEISCTFRKLHSM